MRTLTFRVFHKTYATRTGQLGFRYGTGRGPRYKTFGSKGRKERSTEEWSKVIFLRDRPLTFHRPSLFSLRKKDGQWRRPTWEPTVIEKTPSWGSTKNILVDKGMGRLGTPLSTNLLFSFSSVTLSLKYYVKKRLDWETVSTTNSSVATEVCTPYFVVDMTIS